MNIKIITITLVLINCNLFAQQPSTGWGVNGTGITSGTYWARGGNNILSTSNNIFGTVWNSPIYTITDNMVRSRLNGTQNTLINGVVQNVDGYFGIGRNNFFDTNSPWSMLHLEGTNSSPGSLGWRSWMNTGVFMKENTDNMYLGVKLITNDVSYAVINWGDNNAGIGAVDMLSFNFTGAGYGQLETSQDGMELGKFTPNPEMGTLGVGNFQFISPIAEPVRRLEVLDAHPVDGKNQNKPQLRLTYSYDSNVLQGVFSEFQTTKNGDLYFNSRNSTVTGNFGFHKINPLNTVEISAQINSPYNPTAVSGSSGLRFTTLTSLNSTIPNGLNGVDNTKVLTVDKNGDVVLIKNNVNTSLGNICGSISSNPLLNNWEIPLNNFNFNYTLPSLSTSQINIGQVSCSANSSRLYVENDNLNSAGSFISNGNFMTTPYGVYSKVHNNAFNITSVGVYGEAEVEGPNSQAVGVEGKSVYSSPAGARNIGGKFNAANGFGDSFAGLFTVDVSNSANNFGIRSEIKNGINPFSINLAFDAQALDLGSINTGGNFLASDAFSLNKGVYSSAFGGLVCIGGDFRANSGLVNIGLSASAPISPTDWAGSFNGNVFINGVGTSPGPGLIFSDQNIKNNIKIINKPIDLLLKLRPVSFNLSNAYAPQLNIDTAKTFGLIAQEVELIIPELVKDVIVPAKYDSLGSISSPSVSLKSLNYIGLIPLAISSIQDINNRQNIMQLEQDKSGLSDLLVKNNINNFNALTKIKSLNPVSYNFTNINVPQLTFKSNLDYGFVAQQLQLVYPELVDTIKIPAKYDSLGTVINPSKILKTVNYKAMSALLTRGIQEQQYTIDSLSFKISKQDSILNAIQFQVSNLASIISSCCSSVGSKSNNAITNQIDIELNDNDVVVLNQNIPNPFAEQTVITYNIPVNITKAQLLFFNTNGQLIKTVDIKTRGNGKINVFANDLSSGLYHYSLVTDGKISESKKMIKE